jgi:uncharacterized protein (DUF305 family)
MHLLTSGMRQPSIKSGACVGFLETFFANVRIQWQAFLRNQMKIFNRGQKWTLYGTCRKRDRQFVRVLGMGCRIVLAASSTAYTIGSRAGAELAERVVSERVQQGDAGKPVVVQPGAPGEPSKTLPSSTRGTLPARSQADVDFMQGMIMHHAQAVEMTALIASHTENKDLQPLGARISSSQSSEIKFMRQWLAVRGESASMAMPAAHATGGMAGMDMAYETMPLMPGMLTREQMEALRNAKGTEFDHLFLIGMIQHHNGALTMVKDLFDTAGAGQDADLFNFATDADNTQRAEIRIMETMLEKKSSEEKRTLEEKQ